MSDQSQQSTTPSQSSPPASVPHAPATSAPTPPPAHPLPISPLTGEPYDPQLGALIKKGSEKVPDKQQTIQQVMKPEIERKTGQ